MEVIATARGFYNGLREKGDKFTIKSKDDLGSWMKSPDSDAPDDTEDTAKVMAHIAELESAAELQKFTRDSRQRVKRAAEQRLDELNGKTGEGSGDSTKDAKVTVAELKSQIAESDDIEFLQEQAKDPRKGVSDAATKRLDELKG